LRCHVIASGVVARRSVVFETGMFDETIARGHDFDLWIRLASRGARLAYQRQVLLLRRIHAKNLSGDGVAECDRALATLRRVERTIALSPDEQKALAGSVAWLSARRECELGKQCLRTGNFAGAIDAVSRAYRADPCLKLGAIAVGLRFVPSWLYRIDRARQMRAMRPLKRLRRTAPV
jgi:hypothetical protein